MRITRPRATKLSQITIDADLEMGAHDITLGAAQTVDGLDVSTVTEPLTVAFLKTKTATGSAIDPANANDGSTSTKAVYDTADRSVIIDFGKLVRISQYRVWSYD